MKLIFRLTPNWTSKQRQWNGMTSTFAVVLARAVFYCPPSPVPCIYFPLPLSHPSFITALKVHFLNKFIASNTFTSLFCRFRVVCSCSKLKIS